VQARGELGADGDAERRAARGGLEHALGPGDREARDGGAVQDAQHLAGDRRDVAGAEAGDRLAVDGGLHGQAHVGERALEQRPGGEAEAQAGCDAQAGDARAEGALLGIGLQHEVARA
jgi:hypothetical protein